MSDVFDPLTQYLDDAIRSLADADRVHSEAAVHLLAILQATAGVGELSREQKVSALQTLAGALVNSPDHGDDEILAIGRLANALRFERASSTRRASEN